MTDLVDTAAGSITSTQRPKRARASISELTMIVRPARNPSAVRAFTAAEASEAERYARAMGAEVESLPGI